jgi:hypothetical protein
MKKISLVFSLMLGATLLPGLANAETPAGTEQLAAASSRWSSSVMDRHMPLDAAQIQKLSRKEFRYMDMAQQKRPKAVRNAVIVYEHADQKGTACKPAGTDKKSSDRPCVYRMMM